jgi:hypothetical protein
MLLMGDQQAFHVAIPRLCIQLVEGLVAEGRRRNEVVLETLSSHNFGLHRDAAGPYLT